MVTENKQIDSLSYPWPLLATEVSVLGEQKDVREMGEQGPRNARPGWVACLERSLSSLLPTVGT